MRIVDKPSSRLLYQGCWTHTCLRIPGRNGEPLKLHLKGVGGCIYCGDPGPEKQKEIDKEAVETLYAGVGKGQGGPR